MAFRNLTEAVKIDNPDHEFLAFAWPTKPKIDITIPATTTVDRPVERALISHPAGQRPASAAAARDCTGRPSAATSVEPLLNRTRFTGIRARTKHADHGRAAIDVRNSAAWSVAHSRNVRADAPVKFAHVEPTGKRWRTATTQRDERCLRATRVFRFDQGLPSAAVESAMMLDASAVVAQLVAIAEIHWSGPYGNPPSK